MYFYLVKVENYLFWLEYKEQIKCALQCPENITLLRDDREGVVNVYEKRRRMLCSEFAKQYILAGGKSFLFFSLLYYSFSIKLCFDHFIHNYDICLNIIVKNLIRKEYTRIFFLIYVTVVSEFSMCIFLCDKSLMTATITI